MKKEKIFSEEHQDEGMELVTVEFYFYSSAYYFFYVLYYFPASLEIPTMLMKSFKVVFYPIKTLPDKQQTINYDSINIDLNATPTDDQLIF